VDYTTNSNGWLTEGNGIWESWSGKWVDYTAYFDAGNWNIKLNIIKHGDSSSYSGWYPQYKLHHILNNDTNMIPASDTEANCGFTNLDISTVGEYTTMHTQLNDKYAPPLDANFHVKSAFFHHTETTQNPNPATMLLLGTGLIGIAGFGRKFFDNAEPVSNPKHAKMLLFGTGLVGIAGFGRKKY
jgi:hypothetical protein